MSIYVLRRNNWGEPACAALKEEWPELQIVNKDKEEIPVADWCIRWATTSDVPGKPKIINKASTIHRVFNKGEFRKVLADAGLAPKTIINIMPDQDMYPVIVRPIKHYASDELYVASNETEVKAALYDMRASMEGASEKFEGFYTSEFIDKDQEFRVFVVSGRVVAVLEKHPEDKDQASWGCAGSGDFEYVGWSDWPLAVVRNAVSSFNVSGLDFGAVDVISKGKKSKMKAWTMEINTGPWTSPYYGRQLAKGIRWIVEKNSRDTIPLGETGTWKDFIHPALEA